MCTPSYVYLRTSPIFRFCLVAVSLVGLHETEELLTLCWLLFRFIWDVVLVPADNDRALQLRFRSDQDPEDTCKLFSLSCVQALTAREVLYATHVP